MPYLIGTDEAGYGPNLGPLVVSATVWRVPDDLEDDLYARLADTVVARPADASDGRMAMADSKALYKPGKGLRHLERGLLAALGVLGRKTDDWPTVWAALDPDSTTVHQAVPWYADYETRLPIDADSEEVRSLRTAFGGALDAADVRLVELRSRAVFPREFNELVDHHDSKGLALSHITLGLLAEVMRPLGDEPIRVLCDKHGGRNRYAALLSEHFPDGFVEVRDEGARRSTYRFGPSNRRVEVSFQTKAESFLPAALASMASKYLRELAMRALNDFWCKGVDGLRPTAGYPQDAKRFKADIADAQAELGIGDEMLWRVR